MCMYVLLSESIILGISVTQILGEILTEVLVSKYSVSHYLIPRWFSNLFHQRNSNRYRKTGSHAQAADLTSILVLVYFRNLIITSIWRSTVPKILSDRKINSHRALRWYFPRSCQRTVVKAWNRTTSCRWPITLLNVVLNTFLIYIVRLNSL